jgi:RNA polymerase sigma factor (sigma-70 family)
MSGPDFAAALHTHGGLLARIAASYERNPALRQDLLQDIALALWQALPRWRGEAQLKTFIARIAHNRGVDHLVRRARLGGHVEVPVELPDDKPGPDTSAEASERHRRLLEAVRCLPLGQRQAVTLALEGFRNTEIAETLCLESGAVDVRLSRARESLRRMLGDRNDR